MGRYRKPRYTIKNKTKQTNKKKQQKTPEGTVLNESFLVKTTRMFTIVEIIRGVNHSPVTQQASSPGQARKTWHQSTRSRPIKRMETNISARRRVGCIGKTKKQAAALCDPGSAKIQPAHFCREKGTGRKDTLMLTRCSPAARFGSCVSFPVTSAPLFRLRQIMNL